MCEGFFDKQVEDWRKVRALGWIIQCGYADPEKMPENQMVWWPLHGDVLPKASVLSRARRKSIAERIKQELGGNDE